MKRLTDEILGSLRKISASCFRRPDTDSKTHRAGTAATSKPSFAPEDSARLGRLRQNLRLKAGYDEATIDRLIDLERRKFPNAPVGKLMEAAIERWERDNR